MPELPDLAVYVDALERRLAGEPIEQILIVQPFVLRSVDPPISAAVGSRVSAISLLGKRLVLTLDSGMVLLIHLMIAGRFQWDPAKKLPNRRLTLAAFDVPAGRLLLTEAGTTRRASLHLLASPAELAPFDRGGVDARVIDGAAFRALLQRENRTVKRALTDPRLFAGIGNAYSDEILHAARLSPLTLTRKLTEAQCATLHDTLRTTLAAWTARLRAEVGEGWPKKVTAFHPSMAVHGRFGLPCPVCGAKVQRIRYADNETNYCARCQTGGRVLADRALSRLLGEDFPRELAED
ncbi:MAG: formamidopyrimidine-DNA glycosylase [Gemmatimonadaceae bacterium]|nr:formamidopyrimidine-DNA glycosylase [Gemmatimonadaceae bacterium]